MWTPGRRERIRERPGCDGPGRVTQGRSQHSQIQSDLLQGHQLPCLPVLGLVHHPVGALSDLLYLLEHIHGHGAAWETEGAGPFVPHTQHPYCSSSLHVAPCPAPPHPGCLAPKACGPATPTPAHPAWEPGWGSETAPRPVQPKPPGGRGPPLTQPSSARTPRLLAYAWLLRAGPTLSHPVPCPAQPDPPGGQGTPFNQPSPAQPPRESEATPRPAQPGPPGLSLVPGLREQDHPLPPGSPPSPARPRL